MRELLSHFAHPGLLWLALPILGLFVYDLLRRWGDRPVKRVFAAIVRTVGMLALVGALADPRWHRHEDVAHVVFVVDRSASVPDGALQQAIAEVERLRGNLP